VRALVVDDNPWAAKALSIRLAELGYAVDVAGTGQAGEEHAYTEHYDVLIIDLMLPDRDGIEVCRAIRRRGVEVPILVLACVSRSSHAVASLDAGADDFVTKPYDFDELAARLRALLRRAESHETSVLTYMDVEMHLLRREVRRDGDAVSVTSKEFAILELMLRRPDRVLSRAAIARSVWDRNFAPNSNVVDVHISSLRRKLEEGEKGRVIHTVIGAGYRLGRCAS
jgi:DNA-binding response OmpR family regulator